MYKLFYVGVMVTIISCESYAYLDNGSGSMLVQLLLGGLVGAGAFLKFYWHKVSSWFKKKK